jgi:hypothetical protein
MWPFKKQRQMGLPKLLPFKSGAAFFEYQCQYGQTEIRENMGIVAIVLNAKEDFGTDDAIKIEQDGSQLAMIRVASDDGGFIVPAHTPSGKGDRLKPNDIVIWVPMSYQKELGEKLGDKRAGWVGLLRAKIAPEIDTTKDGFNIISQFD